MSEGLLPLPWITKQIRLAQALLPQVCCTCRGTLASVAGLHPQVDPAYLAGLLLQPDFAADCGCRIQCPSLQRQANAPVVLACINS